MEGDKNRKDFYKKLYEKADAASVANKILNAAGTKLENYTPSTKNRILVAAQEVIKELTQ